MPEKKQLPSCLEFVKTPADQRAFDAALRRAVNSFSHYPEYRDAGKTWDSILAIYGSPEQVPNKVILSRVGNIFGIWGGHATPGGWHDSHAGGSNPRFWASPTTTIPSNSLAPIQGAVLCDAVRRALWGKKQLPKDDAPPVSDADELAFLARRRAAKAGIPEWVQHYPEHWKTCQERWGDWIPEVGKCVITRRECSYADLDKGYARVPAQTIGIVAQYHKGSTLPCLVLDLPGRPCIYPWEVDPAQLPEPVNYPDSPASLPPVPIVAPSVPPSDKPATLPDVDGDFAMSNFTGHVLMCQYGDRIKTNGEICAKKAARACNAILGRPASDRPQPTNEEWLKARDIVRKAFFTKRTNGKPSIPELEALPVEVAK